MKLKKLFTKKEEIMNVNSLSNLTCKNSYVNYLVQNSKNENITNIGILGPYGSGKTSIVRSFVRIVRAKKRTLFISYNALVDDDAKNDSGSLKINFYKELLKLEKKSLNRKNFLNSLASSFSDVKVWASILISGIVSGLSGTIIYFYSSLQICLISVFAIFFGLLGLIFCSDIKEIYLQYKDTKIGLIKDDKLDSDEIKAHPTFYENAIMAILKKERIKYLVIEDCERKLADNNTNNPNQHGFSLESLNQLKSFAETVNQSRKGRKKVKFIYCLNDKCFGAGEERVKYFDLLISILPVENFYSSFFMLGSNSELNKVSQRIKTIVSPYIKNMRLYNALISTYQMDEQMFEGKDYDALFALCSIELLFPRFYNTLFESDNKLESYFSDTLKNGALQPFTKFSQTPDGSNDLEMLMSSFILGGFIKRDYKSNLCCKSSHSLSNNDLEYIQLANAQDTKCWISHIDHPSLILEMDINDNYFIKTFKALNIEYILFLFHHDYKKEKDIIIETIKQNSNNEPLIHDFFDTFFKFKPYSNDMGELIANLPSMSCIYSSFSKLADDDDKLFLWKLLLNNIGYIYRSNNNIASIIQIVTVDGANEMLRYLNRITKAISKDIDTDGLIPLFSISNVPLEDVSRILYDSKLTDYMKKSMHYLFSETNLEKIYPSIKDKPFETMMDTNNKELLQYFTGTGHAGKSIILNALNQETILLNGNISPEDSMPDSKKIEGLILLINSLPNNDSEAFVGSAFAQNFLFSISSYNSINNQKQRCIKFGLFSLTDNNISNMLSYYKAEYFEMIDKYHDQLVNRKIKLSKYQSENFISYFPNNEKLKKFSNILDSQILTTFSSNIPLSKYVYLFDCLDKKLQDTIIQRTIQSNDFPSFLAIVSGPGFDNGLIASHKSEILSVWKDRKMSDGKGIVSLFE